VKIGYVVQELKLWYAGTDNECITRGSGKINRLVSFRYILSIWYNTDPIENTATNSSPIVAYVLFATGTFLPSHCLATPVSFGSIILAFKSWGAHAHTGTQTTRSSHKPPFIFFNMREVGYNEARTWIIELRRVENKSIKTSLRGCYYRKTKKI
jgi:hypothetical protein